MSADVFRPYETNRNDFRYLVQFIWAGSTVDEFLTDDDEMVDSLTSGANEDLYDVRTTHSNGTVTIAPAEANPPRQYVPTKPNLLTRLNR